MSRSRRSFVVTGIAIVAAAVLPVSLVPKSHEKIIYDYFRSIARDLWRIKLYGGEGELLKWGKMIRELVESFNRKDRLVANRALSDQFALVGFPVDTTTLPGED